MACYLCELFQYSPEVPEEPVCTAMQSSTMGGHRRKLMRGPLSAITEVTPHPESQEGMHQAPKLPTHDGESQDNPGASISPVTIVSPKFRERPSLRNTSLQ